MDETIVKALLESLEKQNALVEKQNALIEKQNAAVDAQAAEKEALTKLIAEREEQQKSHLEKNLEQYNALSEKREEQFKAHMEKAAEQSKTEFDKQLSEVKSRFDVVLAAHTELTKACGAVVGKSVIDVARHVANTTEKGATSFEREQDLRKGSAFSASLADAFSKHVTKQQ